MFRGGASQGLVLGLTLFNVFINDPEVNKKSLLIKKISRVRNNDEDRAVIQNTLVCLETWVHSNKVHCNAVTCKGLQSRTKVKTTEWGPVSWRAGAKKHFAVITDKQLNMSFPVECCGTKKGVNATLGCVNRGAESRCRGQFSLCLRHWGDRHWHAAPPSGVHGFKRMRENRRRCRKEPQK